MTLNPQQTSVIEILMAARRIADQARDEGALTGETATRPTYFHVGAVLADSVLQAGLNYSTVVRPRVLSILHNYPEANTISSVLQVTSQKRTGLFLNWQHHEKVSRFEKLVAFLHEQGIEDVNDLRTQLGLEEFCDALLLVRGIGPKTVDYMACLVGIDSIAVDRHVRNFAKKVGVTESDYIFLRKSFCCAADLLELPRRQFDAWLWRSASTTSTGGQLQLAL